MLNAIGVMVAKISKSETGIPEIEANNVLTGVLNTVYIVAGIVAVVVIIVSGLMYITSNGDSNRIQTAKNALLYSVVGLVVIMMAFVITGFVIREVK